MFLSRITLTGFKSFAAKTVIDLEPGITAIVGPNGSGKSNLADAIRWVLGEQNKSRLRLEGREEVIFAGTPKRPRASFAEVVLLFNNENGAFPLDLTEVEISRRLYRSGETDYRLAGKSVRLGDLQALFAQAGVGAGTYAVIGQGMIDTILMSSPSERKALFDEAAGIRGPELGREAAQRKLTATATNLTRLRDLAAELAPQLATFNPATATNEERRLTTQVTDLRTALVTATHKHWSKWRGQATANLSTATHLLHRQQHILRQLKHQQTRSQQAETIAAEHRTKLSNELAALEQSRDQAATALANQRAVVAETQRELQAAASLKAQLTTLTAQLQAAKTSADEARAELTANADNIARATKAVERASREVASAQTALIAIRDNASDGSRDQYLDHALQLLKTLAINLDAPEVTTNQIRLMVHKAGRLLSHATRSGATDLLTELKTAQKQLETAMAKREVAIEHQTNVSITSRSKEIDLTHREAEVARLTAAGDQLTATLSTLGDLPRRLTELQAAEHQHAQTLETLTAGLERHRSQLAGLTADSGHLTAQSNLAAALERAKTAIASLQAEITTARDQQIMATHQLADNAARAKAWNVPLSSRSTGQSLDVLSDQLARAETMLEARTAAHKEQAEQYRQSSTRAQELSSQITDLETAEADLKNLIAELDTLIRRRFKDNFQALATQFSTYFSRLFEGGSATLELDEAEDGTYGVTIKASPKGKRLTSIAALSGGERALAGVALVAAIMRVNPSPFVVLDEIDAALDEANSGRLATILAELEAYSQLIVITHNRQTMKAARTLFGVATTEQHASHIISLRLEQATELAAR